MTSPLNMNPSHLSRLKISLNRQKSGSISKIKTKPSRRNELNA